MGVFMKKKQIANLIMVAVIAVMVISGVMLALSLRAPQEDVLGSEFKITEIPGNALVTSENSENLCSITIRCDTVLRNRELLDPAKAPYVPGDGEILPVTTVELTEGETVFEVLQRVCIAADIQIEYSWTPLYDSYYIEGINHLYEFDCGAESGWMYEVNKWFPNYGCSAYEVQPGDNIEWKFTCIGLGEDVGAERMDSE